MVVSPDSLPMPKPSRADLVTDTNSSITATLENGSSLTGAIDHAALALDASSAWSVTGDSRLTSLDDETGLSGTTITNITGHGPTVTYDATLAADAWLNGATYTLAGGGTQTPARILPSPTEASPSAAARSRICRAEYRASACEAAGFLPSRSSPCPAWGIIRPPSAGTYGRGVAQLGSAHRSGR